MGLKLGAMSPFFWGGGAGSPAEAYLHAKFHFDPSNRLATLHQRHRHDRTGQTVGLTGQDNGPIAYGEPFYKRSTNKFPCTDAPLSAQMNVGVSTPCQRHGAIGRQFILGLLAVRAVYGSLQ